MPQMSLFGCLESSIPFKLVSPSLCPLLQIMIFSTRNFDQNVPLLDTNKINHLIILVVVFDIIYLIGGLFD